MNPQEQVCHNSRCWVYGRRGEGQIVIHSQREQRYRCKRCGKTFSATTGTALYRLHKPSALVAIVVTLHAYHCPIQAIVAAFGLDERTVADWQRRAERQCEGIHTHLVQAGRVMSGQVQADELRVRVVDGIVWLAMSISVPSRLWLGGVISATRDRALIHAALLRAHWKQIEGVNSQLEAWGVQRLHARTNEGFMLKVWAPLFALLCMNAC